MSSKHKLLGSEYITLGCVLYSNKFNQLLRIESKAVIINMLTNDIYDILKNNLYFRDSFSMPDINLCILKGIYKFRP